MCLPVEAAHLVVIGVPGVPPDVAVVGNMFLNHKHIIKYSTTYLIL